MQLPDPVEGFVTADFIDANGHMNVLHYLDWGSGGKPPILLLHGIHTAGWSYEWRSNVDALSEAHDVFVLDLLGFGDDHQA